MTTTFDAQAEAHLDQLLRRAELGLAESTPIGIRTAAMHILDYYQSILKEAAAKVGVDLEGAPIPLRLSKVRSSIGGLQIDSLEGLEKIRTAMYHYENRLPNEKSLRKYLEEARSTRDILLKAANTAVAKEKVMTRAAQQLRAGGEELLRLLPSPTGLYPRTLRGKAERAIEVAKETPTIVGEEGLDLLIEIREAIARIQTREEVHQFYATGSMGDQDEAYEPEPDEDYFRSHQGYQEAEYHEPDFDPREFYPEEGGPDETPDEEPPDDDGLREETPEDKPPDDESE